MIEELVESFCTPLGGPETESDRKLVADAELSTVPFEGKDLLGYAWGAGRNVLLVHGWGSRASHMAWLARALAKGGFRAFAFDAPAHGRSKETSGQILSNMYEFCRSIRAAADVLPDLYAVVGHSMGATSAAFVAAGYRRLAPHKISPERLVLLSPPGGIRRMVEHFCRTHEVPEHCDAIVRVLERQFDFVMDDYRLPLAAGQIGARLLVVHDENDHEIPIADSREIVAARPGTEFLVTRRIGHLRLLAHREVLCAVTEFLA